MEPFYVSRSSVRRIEGVHRRATIAAGDPVDMGVHGPVKELYNLVDAKNLPLPVDFIVASTGT